MKKLIPILTAILVLSSCGVIQTREVQKRVLFIDYRPYADAGFYLSPNDYPGPHTPVGELNLVIDPAVVKVDNNDSPYISNWVTEKSLTADEILSMTVAEATKRGSNGISNLKIEVVTQDYLYYKKEGLFGTTGMTIPVNRYIVSGVLIRIMPEE